MNIKTSKIKIAKNQQDTFEYLSNMSNYKELMPDDIKSFDVHESGKGFSVAIGSMPKVGMKLKETQAPSQIVFESPSSNFEYTLGVDITSAGENESEVELNFDGKFNPLVEMMAKGPLTKFIETISKKLEEKQF